MRRRSWILVILSGLNVLLIVSNGLLLAALSMSRQEHAVATAEIRKARQALPLDRITVQAEKLAVDDVQEGAELNSARATESAQEVSTFSLEDAYPQIDLTRRPDPRAIPEMEPAEFDALLARRGELSPKLLGEALLSGDIDAVLANPIWNLSDRELSPEQRSQLTDLLKDYRYYARFSQVERFKQYVEPELQRLRDAGAFIEYPADQPPPVPDGVRIGHAERSERQGFKRVFYFPPDDFPELAHHERVERERGLQTFLAIYELINPP